MIVLEKLENELDKLEKLELEILEISPYRTLENKAGSSSQVPNCPPPPRPTEKEHQSKHQDLYSVASATHA